MREQPGMNHDDTPRGFVSPTASVGPRAVVGEDAAVRDYATVMGYALGESVVTGHARVDGSVRDGSSVGGHAVVCLGGEMSGTSVARDNATISGKLSDNAVVAGDAVIPHSAEIGPNAVILNRSGYAGGAISHETWDAYTCYTEKAGWYVVLRFACKARALSCWKKEANVVEHAGDISYHRKLYWIEAIERVVDLVEASVVIPKTPPPLDDIRKPKEAVWQT